MKKLTLILLAASLAGCPKPDPTPTPPPPPTGDCPCAIPDAEAAGWSHGAEILAPWNEKSIAQARETVGDCSGATPEDNLRLLAEELLRGNPGQSRPPVCAAQWADSILVQNPADKNGRPIFEQWHVVSYDTNCWASLSNAFKGTWTNSTVASCKKGVN